MNVTSMTYEMQKKNSNQANWLSMAVEIIICLSLNCDEISFRYISRRDA